MYILTINKFLTLELSDMELITGSMDLYCVDKIKVVASYAGTELKVTTTGVEGSIVLQTKEGTITQHNAILRYVAGTNASAGLTGANEFEYAQINQWIDFYWHNIELCFHVLTGINAGVPQFLLCAEDKSRITADTVAKIADALKILDTHLASRTFMVGERVTLADLSLLCICTALAKMNIVDTAATPSLYRWFMTASSNARVRSALGSDITTALTPPSSSCTSDTFSGKWSRGRVRVKELLLQDSIAIGKQVTVKGWVRTIRSAVNDTLQFVELNDGSSVKSIQLVLDINKTIGYQDVLNCGGVGASLSIEGSVVASQGKGQSLEIIVKTAKVLGPVYGGEDGSVGGKYYPLPNKPHSLEYLREKAHLRARTKIFSSAMRMRHAMAYATHKFFNERGFIYTHTPIITAADCEGAGEQFQVTTLLGKNEHKKVSEIPKNPDGTIDYSQDFFGRRYL
jgi:glutathione S-transferase